MFKKQFLQFALAVAASGAVHGQDDALPRLPNASVTIPYSELRELWQAAQSNKPPPAKPPVAASLLSARYEIELRGDQISGWVECDAQSFGGEWTLLPLVSSEMQVDKIEPATAKVVVQDGAYTLLTDQASRQQVKLHFNARLMQEGEDQRLDLPGTKALVNVISLRGIPAEKTAQVGGSVGIVADKGATSFHVAPQERLQLRIVSNVVRAPEATEWRVATQCLARFADDMVHYETHVVAMAETGSGLGLDLKLPAAMRVVAVESEDIAGWRSDEVDREWRRIQIEWRTPNVRQRQVDLVYEAPQTTEGEWTLHAPETEDDTKQTAIYAVTAEAGIGLTSGIQNDRPSPPRWLAAKLDGLSNVLVTRSETLTARRLPVVEVAPAVVERATFNMRVVADGSLLNEQTYFVRTRAALVWRVQLPEKSELLSCAVNEQRMNPIDRGEGTLEVPIAPSAGDKPTRITLSYTARTSAFQPVSGRLKIELPKTPLLIHALEWDLAIPAEYEVAALEGNVSPASGAPAIEGSTVVRLKKELCRNERPAIELFYQRPEAKP